jgi:tripartite-type tricarboxylate transporter receptor subunit TctC
MSISQVCGRIVMGLIPVAFCLAVGAAGAQEYHGPITLVVGYPAGGSADIGARILAEKLPAILQQPVIVENRAGAGGQIAAKFVKAAPADGSVLFFTNGHTVVTVPQVAKNAGFDTTADFRPVAQFGNFELVLVANPSTSAKTLEELMTYFGANSRARNIAIPAPASAPEFIVGRLAQLLKSEVQPIPYRGAAPAVQDLLGGQVLAAVLPVADVLQYQKLGQLTALAVTNGTALLPNVPSFTQLGLPELAASDFLGIYAPAKLSDQNVGRYNAAIRKILEMPDVIAKMQAHAIQPKTGMPQGLADRHAESSAQVRSLIKSVNFQPQ